MASAIIFDCEFLVAEGAPARFWCGPFDPDPVIAQIGAAKLFLEGDFPIIASQRLLVRPQDRFGEFYALDPLFTGLTGISEADIQLRGQPLAVVLAQLEQFAEGAGFWSWGKDELNMMALSCYIAGIAPLIPATRFGNACNLLLRAGMPYDDVARTSSSGLAGYFSISCPPLKAHDALDDATSVALVLQYLLREGRLTAGDFQQQGHRVARDKTNGFHQDDPG